MVVIPALDEEHSIGRVIEDLGVPSSQIVAVDNGSSDATAAVAAAAGARVVSEPRRGYGSACLAGIAAAGDVDVIAFVDADYSDHPDQLPRLLGPIAAGEADLVIGSRTLGHRSEGAHPWHAVLGTRLCVGLMNALVGTRATDLGPFRAIRLESLRGLDMRDRAFGWTVEMQIKAAQHGLRVVEVPVDYRPRIGRSKVSGTLRGTLGAAAGILGTIARQAARGRRR